MYRALARKKLRQLIIWYNYLLSGLKRTIRSIPVSNGASPRRGEYQMAHIESFSTAGLDPRHKLTFWNDRASESVSPLVSEPQDIRAFNGSIVRGTLGELSLAEVYSDAQIVRHSRSHVARTRDSMFFLHLQLEGESISRQDGRETLLHAGDFTLCDSTRRYEIIFKGANRM